MIHFYMDHRLICDFYAQCKEFDFDLSANMTLNILKDNEII